MSKFLNRQMMSKIERKFPGASKCIGKRLLICGGRDLPDIRRNRLIIRTIINSFMPSALINGCCSGADTIANREFRKLGKKPEEYPAKWNKYGNAAGPIRNSQMLKEGKPDIVIAFYFGKEKSRGTKDMVNKAKSSNVFAIEFDLMKGKI